MPIYEYRCSACGCEKEYLQKLSEPPKTDCPECGKPALQKKLTAAGFQLKGSGWYVTDFRDSGKKQSAKKDTDAERSKAASGEGKATSGEGKPASSEGAGADAATASSANASSATTKKPDAGKSTGVSKSDSGGGANSSSTGSTSTGG